MTGGEWLTTWWLPSRMMDDRNGIGLGGIDPWVLQGVGVTAFGSLDAQELVCAFLEVTELPDWLEPPERCHAVPEGLLGPHGSPIVRGVWYPTTR